MKDVLNWDLLSTDLKQSVEDVSNVVNAVPLKLIKLINDGKLPHGYWDDDYLLSFHIFHASYVLNCSTDTSLLSFAEKAIAMQSIVYKFCDEAPEKVIQRYEFLTKSPNIESQRGHRLAAKFCSIVMNFHETEYPDDEDIICLEKHSKFIYNFFVDNLDNGLSHAFVNFHVTLYVLIKFLDMSEDDFEKKLREIPPHLLTEYSQK